MFTEFRGWRSVWYFYFGVIWSQILFQTLPIEVDVCIAFQDLAFQVFCFLYWLT